MARGAVGVASRATLANAFTLLRVALVPVIAGLYFVGGATARWWAFAVFVAAALTDSVDGWVARRLGAVTPWGQLADPAADKALVVGSLAVLASASVVPWWAVAVIVVREVAVTVQRAVLVRRGVVLPAGPLGKVKTVLQIVAVTIYLLPAAPVGVARIVLWLALVMTVVSGAELFARGRRLARAG